MKTYQILFKHTGETTSDAKVPIQLYSPDLNIDLTETKLCRVLWCKNILEPTLVYEILKVKLPDWFMVNDWLKFYTEYDFLLMAGMKKSANKYLQQNLFWLLINTSEEYIYQIIKLINRPFLRSQAAEIIQKQARTWLYQNPGTQASNTPISKQEYDLIFNPITAKKCELFKNQFKNTNQYQEITAFSLITKHK